MATGAAKAEIIRQIWSTLGSGEPFAAVMIFKCSSTDIRSTDLQLTLDRGRGSAVTSRQTTVADGWIVGREPGSTPSSLRLLGGNTNFLDVLPDLWFLPTQNPGKDQRNHNRGVRFDNELWG